MLPVNPGHDAVRFGFPEPGPTAAGETGGVSDRETGPHPDRWSSFADIRVDAEVHVIEIRDRLIDVPWHGRVTVVRTGPQPSAVVALDRQRQPLAHAKLDDHAR